MEIAVFVRTQEAVAKFWYSACKGVTERKKENIVAGTKVEDVNVAMILFTSSQLHFRTCLLEATKLWETIRKLRLLIIVLPLLPENNLQILGEWIVQVDARHTEDGDVIRIEIDIPFGLYILDKRRTVGFKMRRLQPAPPSLHQFITYLFRMGVQLEYIGYCKQHWVRRDRLDPVLGWHEGSTRVY